MQFNLICNSALHRTRENKPLIANMGRKQIIGDDITSEISLESKTADLVKDSFTKSKFKASVDSKLKKRIDDDPNKPISAIPSYSQKTLERALKKHCLFVLIHQTNKI